MLYIDRRCERELEALPISVREDLADALARVEQGHALSMPLSRPMPSIGAGAHELRLRDRAGVYRVIYVFVARTGKEADEGVATVKTTSGAKLARRLHISPARGMEAVIKAKLISAVLKAVASTGLTHAEIAKRSGLPRSAITGILSGSLQKVTIDRVLRLIEAVGLVAEVKVRRAA